MDGRSQVLKFITESVTSVSQKEWERNSLFRPIIFISTHLAYLILHVYILTFIALIPDLVIRVILAFEMGGLYSFSEYNWKIKGNNTKHLSHDWLTLILQ